MNGKKKTYCQKKNILNGKAYFFFLIFLLIITPVFGQTIINENVINTFVINPQADSTFNRSQTLGACGNFDGISTRISLRSSGGSLCDTYRLFNYSAWNRDRIADVELTLDIDGNIDTCTAPTVLISPYNLTILADGTTFNDSRITPVGANGNGSLFPASFPHEGGFNLTSPTFACGGGVGDQIRSFNVTVPFSYNYDKNLEDAFTLVVTQPSQEILMRSWTREEAGKEPNLTIVEKSFRTVKVSTSNTRFILYDFEGNQLLLTNSSTIFNSPTIDNVQGVYDLIYDSVFNVLKPVGALGSTQEAINLPAFDDNTDSNLEAVPCGSAGFTTNNVENLNDQPNEFNVICFNLSAQHNGRQYYGVWKLINNTITVGGLNRDIDLFLTMVSPANFDVQFRGFTPEKPQEGNDVAVNFITTLKGIGSVRYRYADVTANLSDDSVFSSFFTVNDSAVEILNSTGFGTGNETNLTDHFVIIPNVIADKFYEFDVRGLSETGTTAVDNNTDSFYNFSVGVFQAFETGNATGQFPSFLDNLADTGICPNASDCTYFIGFILLLIATFVSWVFGGMEMGLGVFILVLFTFAFIGLLPQFLAIPMLLIVALVVARFIRQHIGRGN